MTGRRQPSSPRLEDAVRCPLLERDLEQWVRCCTCRFLPLARRVAGDDDIAHDALQQSWIIVLEKLHQYRGGSPACGWVGAIVRHEAVHGVAAQRRESPLSAARGEADSLAEQTPSARTVWESPEASVYAHELTRLLLEVIDELPPTFREVVRLRDIEHRPPREVARRLHISTQNVAVRLPRAHKLLRPAAPTPTRGRRGRPVRQEKPVIAPLPKLSYRENARQRPAGAGFRDLPGKGGAR